MHQVRQIHQPPIFGMTTFQGLTATQWRNRINEYNPGMYTKEFLKNKTAKELAQIQNGKSYGVSESKSAAGSKPMSAIRAKLEAIKQQKVSAIKKEKSASDSVQQLLAALSKPDKAPVRKPKAPACKPAKAKDETADLIKKLIGALQGTVGSVTARGRRTMGASVRGRSLGPKEKHNPPNPKSFFWNSHPPML